MAGIDFMAIARGRQAALDDNYKDIRRIQEQEQYGFARETQMAKLQQERQNREATSYLSTVMPNLQRYADQGMNPVDALLNQRSMIQNHAAFQSMAPEVQSAILNGLGETAKLQAAALAKAGNYTDLERLTSAFGSVNPLNPLGIAAASGDPLAVFNAANERTPGAFTLSQDQKFVIDRAGNQVPLNDWAANVAGGLGEANSAAGSFSAFQQAGQQQRAQTAAEVQRKQEDTAGAVTAIQSGRFTPAQIKAAYPFADPSIFGETVGTLPVIPQGQTATPATAEQAAALSTPLVPGAVTPGAATPGAAPVAAAVPVPTESWQQIVTQVQAANQPQLNQSLSTVVQQIEEGKARQEELVKVQEAYQAQLRQVMPSGTVGPSLGGMTRVPDAVTGGYIAALQAELAKIDQEFGTIAQNMRGFEQIARQIQTRQRVLGLPTVAPLAAPPASDWVKKLQTELSQ